MQSHEAGDRRNLVCVFIAKNYVEADLVGNMLREHDIAVIVNNRGMTGIFGLDGPASSLLAVSPLAEEHAVFVFEDQQVPAQEIVTDYLASHGG